ncbi:iron ABC transporter [Flavisolibacter tropicus]|uniref:Iron ABC transporter n=2 Tax=Flavisolibacter tropicus TaxID=1492898 RepID=A0A172TRZ5_9BACT|nr:iron ABC transporter [Flavisolibacter tropicus]
MPVYTDQLNRTVTLPATPKRIISLVPSQTELLYDLELKEQVVGITKFCIHPKEWFRTKTRIGGTKTLHLDKIRELHPDLIIANKEENVQEQIEALAKEFPVWISDVNNLPEALEMIEQIGLITNKKERAEDLSKRIESAFFNFKPQTSNLKLNTCYLIWKDPYMTVGGDTFIHNILSLAGLENIYGSKQRYPEITIAELQTLNCDLLLLSSEPYPFKQKHIEELQAQLPHTKILLVDGEAFSWYGSRLLHTPAHLQQLQEEIASLI